MSLQVLENNKHNQSLPTFSVNVFRASESPFMIGSSMYNSSATQLSLFNGYMIIREHLDYALPDDVVPGNNGIGLREKAILDRVIPRIREGLPEGLKSISELILMKYIKSCDNNPNVHPALIMNNLLNLYSQAITKYPTMTGKQFENWFMGKSEGTDGDYDAAYWENPNLTFPQQNLPTYNDYYNGMARSADGKLMTGADNVYGLVGGAVQQARIANPISTANTCALKVSIALNRAGVIIPSLPGKTLEGSGEFAGKYFFLNARSLNSWMRETFGTNPATTTTPSNENHRSYTAADGGLNGADFPDKLKGINAIYSMITTDEYYNQTKTSGHSDLLFTHSNGLGECVYKCFFNLPIQRIDLWILN